MNAEAASLVNEEALPSVRAIARDGAVQAAIGSLAAWGGINLGAWLLLGGESREFLSGLSTHPEPGIYLLIYGGLALGAMMLAFAALGALTRFTGTIFLDGISLIAVGLWNVTNDFIAMGALRPYGYTIEQPNAIWIMLGLCQIVWGCRQLAAFGRMGSWSVPRLPRDELAGFKGKLQSFAQLADDPEKKIVKCSITTKGPMGLDVLSRTTQYTGVLLSSTAVMVSVKLDDCLTIHKQALDRARFGPGGAVHVQVEDKPKDVVFSPRSVIALKTWLGTRVEAGDVRFAASTKALTLTMLDPYLRSDDAALRAASVAALAGVTDDQAGSVVSSYLDDQDSAVQAAALKAAIQLKLTEAGLKAVQLLTSPDAPVRTWAAKYLSAVPQPSATPALEQALAGETTRAVKKDLKRALLAAQKMASQHSWAGTNQMTAGCA